MFEILNCVMDTPIYKMVTDFSPLIASIIALMIATKSNELTKDLFKRTYRPRLEMYVKGIQLNTLAYCLILRNYGKTSAKITKFDCVYKWSDILLDDKEIPFDYVVGLTLLPNQNIYTVLDINKFRKHLDKWHDKNEKPCTFNVYVEYYESDYPKILYKECLTVNLSFDIEMRHSEYDIHFKEL